MVGTFALMATKKFKRVYLTEWRQHAGFTQKTLAKELDLTDVTVSRWESGTRRMNVDDLVAVSGVIGRKIGYPVEPQDLFRHPKTLSLDSMMRNTPDALRKQAEALIAALRGSEDPK